MLLYIYNKCLDETDEVYHWWKEGRTNSPNRGSFSHDQCLTVVIIENTWPVSPMGSKWYSIKLYNKLNSILMIILLRSSYKAALGLLYYLCISRYSQHWTSHPIYPNFMLDNGKIKWRRHLSDLKFFVYMHFFLFFLWYKGYD